MVQKICKKLGRTYLVATNARLQGNKGLEVDLLVVGPGRISIIEVKNYRGRLAYAPDGWCIVKKGRYRKSIADPYLGLNERVSAVKDSLVKARMDMDVVGMLVFAGDTDVDDALYGQLRRREPGSFFLSRGDQGALLDAVQSRKEKSVPAEDVCEVLLRT